MRAVECTSEQILYQHGRALQANGYHQDGDEYIRQAWQEMDRKRRLIPAGSPFRKTYLALPLHKRIAKAYKGLKQQ